MPENEHTIVLNAKDQTSQVFKQAAENAERLNRILKSMGRDGRGPSSQESAKRQEAVRRETEQIRRRNDEAAKSNRLVRDGTEELAMMATGYLSVGYAISKAREGFMSLAKGTEQLRVTKQRIGATDKQIKDLEQTLKKIGATFGNSSEETLGALEAFREAAYIGKDQFGQVLKIGPAIVEQARRFGVSSEAMAESLGSFMHQLEIAPDQAEQALGAISAAANDMNLNFDQLNRFAPQLSETMKSMGETGMPGLVKALTVLGHVREQFGSTTQAARALDANLQQIQRGDGVMGAMGMDLEQWTGTLDRVIQRGGSTFDWYIERIKEARKMGFEWGKLFEDPKQRNFWRAITENQEKLRQSQNQLMRESKEFQSGNIKDLENLDLAIRRLSKEWDSAWKALAAAGGPATGVVSKLTEELKEARRILDEVKRLSERGFFGAARDLIVGEPSGSRFKIPSPIDVLRGMMNGPGGSKPSTPPTPLAPRAAGGPVSAGEGYMVGERGPEPFFPSQSGSIIPNKTFTEIDLNTERQLAVLTEMRDLMRKAELDRSGGEGVGQPSSGGSSSGSFGGAAGGGQVPSAMGSGGAGGGGQVPGIMGSVGGGGAGGGAGGGGGTLGDRLNNPGNLKYGPFAKSMGSTGAGPGGHAVFPDYATGRKAMETLLTNKASGQSIAEINRWYAEDPNWKNNVAKKMGVGTDWRLSNPADAGRLADAIQGAEGTRVGGGGGRGGTSGATGGAAPPEVLAQARQVAMAGGPEAVSKFMSQQGYPKNGAWCGQFAASVVTAAGGTPPKNPEVASNWRNYGSEVSDPQPGDIAVRRGSRYGGYAKTGSTGSHVTIVDNVAGNGRFVGLGGNQGKMYSNFPTDGYQFFRGQKAAPSVQATQPMPPVQGLDEVRSMRSELEQPITIRAQMDRGADSQFRRATMRREVNREVREGAWNGYSDIGAA